MKKLIIVVIILSLITSCTKEKSVKEATPYDKNISSEKIITHVKGSHEMTEKIIPANEEDLSKNERWEIYRTLREKSRMFLERGDFDSTIQALVKAGEQAVELERPDIASWQYNNAGKTAIDWFKKKTNYDVRMQKLIELKDKTNRREYLVDTIDILKREMKTIDHASSFLSLAEKLNKKKPDEKRSKVIASNLLFVGEIKKLTEEKK